MLLNRVVFRSSRPCQAITSSSVHTLRNSLRSNIYAVAGPSSSGYGTSTSSSVSRRGVSHLKSATTTESETEDEVKWWNRDLAPNMHDVSGVQSLVDALADAGDKLVIVEYYAPWCNACKALFPKICKIMNEHVDDVVFLKICFESNKDMCKNMGVKVLPYFKLFRGAEGKVAEFSCTVSKIQRLRDAIAEYAQVDFCSLEEPTSPLEEFPEVHPSGEHHHPDADTITQLAWH